MTARTFALTAAALILHGCGSAPPFDRTEIPVDPAPAWTAEQDSAALAADADPATTETAPWWTTFGNADLDSLVTEALESNHNLQAAAARVDRAAALAKAAGADLYPQLNGNFNAQRRKQNFIGFPVPGGSGVLSSTTNSYGVSLDTSWELDLWGRVRAGKSAAAADFQAAAAELAAARLSLAGQTAKTWFALIEARQQRDLARETVETYRETTSQVRERFNRGVRTSLDLRLALANLAQAEALLELREQQLDRITRQLEILLGRYPAAALQSPADLPGFPEPVPTGLPAELIARRPDLAAAERRLAASGKRTAQAKRALYPRLSLTASAGTASNELEDLLDGDFSVWSLVGNLAAPLFQGGRLRANVAQNRAASEEAVALFADAALRAFAEVENALTTETSLTRREVHVAEAARQSEAARQVADEQYRSGLVDYITVLESQRRALNAQSELLQVRRNRLDARIDLHLALGGGFRVEDLPGISVNPPADQTSGDEDPQS